MTVYVTADWSRVVREGDPEAAFGVAESDIDERGLRAAYDAFHRPAEPEAKEAPTPPNKSAKRPATK